MEILLRKIQQSDYEKGFPELLSQLTSIGNIDQDLFYKYIQNVNHNKNHHVYVFHDLDLDKIIGTGTIIIINKFIHSSNNLAIIEDVVIHKLCRGQHLGKDMITKLINTANDNFCYKIILNCDNQNIDFYKKLGFKNGENSMVKYLLH